jgi:hypothetical protein
MALQSCRRHVANDPERLTQVQREAEVVASLNQPNIARIEPPLRVVVLTARRRIFEKVVAKAKRRHIRLDDPRHTFARDPSRDCCRD